MNVLRKLTIPRQMYLIAALTMGVFVVILLFNYNRSVSYITKNNEIYTNDIFFQMEQTILSNYDVIKRLSYNLAYNKSIQDHLMDGNLLSRIERYPTIKNLFLNLSTVKPGVLDLAVIGNDGKTLSFQGSVLREFGEFMPPKADSYFSEIKSCSNIRYVDGYCFAVGTTIYSSDIKNQYTSEIGRIMLVLDSAALTGGYDLKSLQPGTSVFLLDRKNTVFMSNERDMLGQTFPYSNLPDKRGTIRMNGELTHVQVADLPQIGGKVVRAVPDDVFFHDLRKLRRQTVIALAVGILLLMIPFLLIVNNMILPLRKLYRYMRISGSDDLNKRIDLRGSSEVEVIGLRYNQMLSDVQDLTGKLLDSNERLLKSEIEKKRAEYDYLKSQVNPHFLYNTLDSMSGIASAHRVPHIREMTQALSRIFRYSVKGHDFVPLRDEIRIVESYLNIQTVRFSQRFDFVCRIPESLMECTVPKMILQPIVENAVYHGLEPTYDKGTLAITAHLDNEGRDLIVDVTDDGVGMDETRLDICRAMMRTDQPDTGLEGSPGVGLLNVHHRLQFLYGSEYGMNIDSKVKEGTVATIKIPARWEGGNTHVQGDDRG